MKSVARLTFDKVAFNKDNDLHLVVSLTAPRMDWQAKRPSIMVVPVIDISGSMAGPKLEFAKQSVMKLIDHLQPGDFTGLIVFESNVEVVAPLTEVTQTKKDELKAKVSKLSHRGMTAFSGGMLAALEQVNKSKVADDVVIRVIMFTDGHANVGVKGRDMISLLETNLGKASLSAFGYGEDADQELLADIAKSGKGNYAFIKNPDDAPAAFAKELGGLLSTYAQNVSVDVVPQGGNKLLNVVSDVSVVTDNDLTSIRLPEVLSEETRNLVIKMTALKLSQADILPEDHVAQLAAIKITYETLDQSGTRTKHTEDLLATLTFVNPGDEQTKASSDVDAMVAVAQMVRAQVEAEKLAAAGQYDAAVILMNDTSEDFVTRGHVAISNTTAKIGTRMRSASEFTKSSGYRASTYSAGTRAMGLSGSDSEAAEDLAEIGVNFVNSAQESIMESFKGDETPTITSENNNTSK